MPWIFQKRTCWSVWISLAFCCAGTGCTLLESSCCPPPVPHELSRITPPPYVIEPPDILIIDAVRLVPKPPYRIEPLDVLAIQVPKEDALPGAPISGLYSVEPDGTVNFGYSYGTVQVSGMTLEQAKIAMKKYLEIRLNPPIEVRVQVSQSKAMQQIRG